MTATETSLYNCPEWCTNDHDTQSNDPGTLDHLCTTASFGVDRVHVGLGRFDSGGELGSVDIEIVEGTDEGLTPDDARAMAAELLRLADLAELT